MKCFFCCSKRTKLYPKKRATFYGVVEKMIDFAKFVVSTIEDPDVRENLWINAPNHFIGDHSRPLKDNK